MAGQQDRISRASLINKPTPSDLSSQVGGASSSLSGALPLRKHRYSFFDRIGARQFASPKGQLNTSYAGNP